MAAIPAELTEANDAAAVIRAEETEATDTSTATSAEVQVSVDAGAVINDSIYNSKNENIVNAAKAVSSQLPDY